MPKFRDFVRGYLYGQVPENIGEVRGVNPPGRVEGRPDIGNYFANGIGDLDVVFALGYRRPVVDAALSILVRVPDKEAVDMVFDMLLDGAKNGAQVVAAAAVFGHLTEGMPTTADTETIRMEVKAAVATAERVMLGTPRSSLDSLLSLRGSDRHLKSRLNNEAGKLLRKFDSPARG